VRIIDHTGAEIARGLSNYSSEEAARLSGLRSSHFFTALG
jgi:glutamate 5-kinase